MKNLLSKITASVAVVAALGFAGSLQENSISEINTIDIPTAKASQWACSAGEGGWVWCIQPGSQCGDSRECLTQPH